MTTMEASRERADVVVITGRGAVTPLGDNIELLWRSLDAGQHGFGTIDRFPTDIFDVHIASMMPMGPVEEDPEQEISHATRLGIDMAVRAAREAWTEAGLVGVDPTRVAMVLGTTHLERRGALPGRFGPHTKLQLIAEAMGVGGPLLLTSTACSASARAIMIASQWLMAGLVDVVFAGGTSTVSAESFAGFHSMGVLARTPCAPFSAQIGTSLGEGAGFLVLERLTSATARGARWVGAVQGWGIAADAYHLTSPDPRGGGVARSIQAALIDANLSAQDIHYINAHATGTAANDAAEWSGYLSALGNHANTIPISASKSVIGHTLYAAGVLEAIITLCAMERQVVPHTLHHTHGREFSPLDVVAQNTPRPHSYHCAMTVNSAFGGANAALILGRDPRPIADHTREVELRGVGLVTPWGRDISTILQMIRTQSGAPLPRRVEPLDLSEYAPRADPRGLNPLCAYLTAATALCLQDAGVTIRGDLRDRVGLFVGMARPSPTSVDEFWAAADLKGWDRVSARAFGLMVLNAPAGACARLLSLKGPHDAVSVGEGSGLAAVVLAAEHLSHRQDADYLLAGGADELPGGDLVWSEGACCVTLGVRQPGSPPGIRLLAWATLGAGQAQAAAEEVLRRAGLTWDHIDVAVGDLPEDLVTEHFSSVVLGRAESLTSALDLALAVALLRERDRGTALVVAARGECCTTALVISTEDTCHLNRNWQS